MAEVTYGPKDTQIIDVNGELYVSYDAGAVTYVWKLPEGSELWQFTDLSEEEYKDPDKLAMYKQELEDAGGYRFPTEVSFEDAFIDNDRLVFAGSAKYLSDYDDTDSITEFLEEIEKRKIDTPWWSNDAYVDFFTETYINYPDNWQEIMADSPEVSQILGSMGITDDSYNRWIVKATKGGEFQSDYLDNYESLNAIVEQNGAEVPDDVLRYIANEWNYGRMSKTKAIQQITKVIDPYTSYTLNQGVKDVLEGKQVSTVKTDEDTVKDLMKKWLPKSDWLSNEDIAEEAGKIRNNSNYKAQLIEKFKDKRYTTYSMYDRETSWENILSSKQAVIKQIWGQDIEEGNPVLDSIIQMNDTAKEKSFLRKKGLEDGVEKVVNDLLEAQISAYGVRGSNMGVIRSGGFVDR